jgi:hypothetical protein
MARTPRYGAFCLILEECATGDTQAIAVRQGEISLDLVEDYHRGATSSPHVEDDLKALARARSLDLGFRHSEGYRVYLTSEGDVARATRKWVRDTDVVYVGWDLAPST